MRIVDDKHTPKQHQYQHDSNLQKAPTMQVAANIMHQVKVAADEVRLVGIDHHCATLSPKVTKRPEDALQHPESRNIEKVTKRRERNRGKERRNYRRQSDIGTDYRGTESKSNRE